MPRSVWATSDHPHVRRGGGGGGALSYVLAGVLGLLLLFVCLRVTTLYGLTGLTVATGALVAFALLAVLSLRNLELAVMVWIVSIAGFRGLLIVDLPGMPDMTPDRLLLMWIVFAVLLRAIARRSKPVPPFTLDVLVVVHTLYLLGSCLILNPLSFNMWTRSYLMPAAAYFFGKYLMHERRWFVRVLALLVVINLYMGITSIAEHFRIAALVWPKFIFESEKGFSGRSLGIFKNPGVLGVFIGMVLPFQFYFHLAARSAFVRVLHLVGIGICAIGLFFTYTRSTWLATVVGLLILAVVGHRYYLRRLFVYGIAIAVIGATGLLSLKQDTFLQERMGNENTIEGRINIVVTAFRMWQHHPILGVGFKRFNEEADNYRETVEVPFFGMIKSGIDRVSSPHDIYVAVLAEEGLLGASMQTWIYGYLIWLGVIYVRRQRRVAQDEWHLAAAPPVFGLIAVYFLGGIAFDYRFFETLNSLLYLFGGVLVGWSQVWTRSHASVRSLA